MTPKVILVICYKLVYSFHERLFLGFLFRVYLFSVHKLIFQIISSSKNDYFQKMTPFEWLFIAVGHETKWMTAIPYVIITSYSITFSPFSSNLLMTPPLALCQRFPRGCLYWLKWLPIWGKSFKFSIIKFIKKWLSN